MKQTEIGMIPDDWEVKEFGNYSTIVRGGSPRPIQDFITTNSSGINWIKIGDVKPNDKYIVKTEEKIIPAGKSRSREVNPGDFILSNSMSFGRPYILKINGCIHDGWLAIQNYQETFDVDYLYYLLGSDEVFKQYISMAAGSSVQNLNKQKVSKLLVPLPPTLAEQQKIAKALSDVDNVISTLEKLITKKKNLKQGTMQQLLTGKKRLPGFAPAVVEPVETTKFKQTEIGEIPEDWEVKELGEVAKNFTGLTFSPDDVCDYGTLVLRSSNIQNDMLSFNDNVYVNMNIPERAIAHTGDILICVRNGSKRLIGKSALITESANNCAFGAFMTILRTELLNQQFLFYVWQSDLIQKQIEESMGATINQITNKDIRHYLIAYPKSNAEQTAIANVLSSMDKEIEALETKLGKYRNLKTGMMQQLLTGKIRLRNTQNSKNV